jgi:hypothetical protein
LDTDRKSYVEFDKSRLKPTEDASIPAGWRTVNISGNTVARYNPSTYAPSATPDAPFFYLESRCYRLHHMANLSYGSVGSCKPYLWSDAYDTNKNGLLDQAEWDKKQPSNDMSELEMADICANPKSFQIISAGLDGNFGANGDQIDVNIDGRQYTVQWKSYPSGKGYADDDNDNITNFSKSGIIGDDKPE